MKTLCLVCLLFVYLGTAAQTPKAIETDLVRSFEKISGEYDSLEKANNVFTKKLQYYTSKYPHTLTQKFSGLSDRQLDISSSTDGLFRIYSWDTSLGGSMHDYRNVFQYNSNGKTLSFLDGVIGEESSPNYFKMYTFNTAGKTYYLAIYLTVSSTKDAGEGIRIFTIEKGKLIEPKIIKTASRLTNEIYYDYDFFSVVDMKVRPGIQFDSKLSVIKLPLVTSNGKVTKKTIDYKFNGTYFVRVNK